MNKDYVYFEDALMKTLNRSAHMKKKFVRANEVTYIWLRQKEKQLYKVLNSKLNISKIATSKIWLMLENKKVFATTYMK